MSEFIFGVTSRPPSRKQAAMMDKICKEEAGSTKTAGFDEVNLRGGNRAVNGGQYQGCFFANGRGEFENDDLCRRVNARVEREVGSW